MMVLQLLNYSIVPAVVLLTSQKQGWCLSIENRMSTCLRFTTVARSLHLNLILMLNTTPIREGKGIQ